MQYPRPPVSPHAAPSCEPDSAWPQRILDDIRGGDEQTFHDVAADVRVNPATVFRWFAKGVKLPDGSRVKLAAVRIGSRLRTSRRAVNEFVAATTGDDAAAPPTPRTAAQRNRAAERAEAELEAAGV